jgi:hypothetical protein
MAAMIMGEGQEDIGCQAGTEVAGKGAEADGPSVWGRQFGFAHLGVPKRGWQPVGRRFGP